MVALSAIGGGYVTAQNVELTCMSLAHLKNRDEFGIHFGSDF